MNCQPQDGAIDGRQPFESPVFSMLDDDRVECCDIFRGTFKELVRECARLSGSQCLRISAAKLAGQLSHFDGRQPRLKSLVAALESRTVDGLLQCVAGQHAKYDWQAAVHLRE